VKSTTFLCNSYQRNKLLVHIIIEPAHEHLAYVPPTHTKGDKN